MISDPQLASSAQRRGSPTGTSGRHSLPCSIAFMVASATAVRRRSTPRAGQAERADGLDHPVDRHPLVAGSLGDLERGQRAAAGVPVAAGPTGRAIERDEGDVVLLLPAGPVNSSRSSSSRSISASPPAASPTSAAQPREAEHLAVRVVRLDERRRCRAARRSPRRERRPPAPRSACRASGRAACRWRASSTTPFARADAREVVAGVGEAQVPGRRVEHGVEAGHEHVRRHLGAQQLVGPARARRPASTSRGASARRMLWVVAITIAAGHALVGDVADHEPDPAVGQRDEVVEVAADLPGRPVVRRPPASRAGRAASCGRNCCWISWATRSSWSIRSRWRASASLLAHEVGDPDGRRPRCRPGCRAAGGRRAE